MKKVVLASLLVCATIASGLSTAFGQQPVNLGSAAQGASAPCALPDAEYTAYTNGMNQSNPQAKASGIEAYLTAYPTSACPDIRLSTLEILMATYSGFDAAKTLSAADRVLQLDPTNIQALTYEAYLRKGAADAMTDATAKQAALDAAAGFAQRGLAAPKPASMSAADFKKAQDAAFPIFYSTIGEDALGKKDSATAIDAYKKELAYVPLTETENPKTYLQETYYLALAYYQSTPPDYLDCTYYMSRFVAYAPEPYKSQATPLAKYCYTKYHGAADGYDAVATAAAANLNPPAGLFDSIKPAPTPAEVINNVFATTPDLGSLAPGDMEFILQNGTPDQAAKVWNTVKDKSREFPNVLVVASTPTQVQVALSDDAVQSKTADFTFNLTPPDPIPDLKEHATPAEKAAYKKKEEEAQKLAAQIAVATAPGQTVTLDGTYDSYTPKPVMIMMSDGAVVLPKPDKPAAAAHHPTHTTTHTTRSSEQ